MNPYIIAAIAAIWAGSLYLSYEKGESTCIAKAEKAALEYREKEIALINDLEKAKQNREVVYQDKVRVIQGAVDPSGCLDAPLPESFTRGLRSAGGSETKREYHR